MRDFFKRIFHGDLALWSIIGILMAISAVEMFSAISQVAYKTTDYLSPFFGHVRFLALGLFVIIMTHHIPYRIIRPMYFILVPLAAILLILTPFLGAEVNGAVRAIKIFGFEFQPLEVGKFAVLLLLADVLSRYQKEQMSHKTFWLTSACILFFCGAIGMQNLSTAVMLFGISILMMIIGRVSLKKVALLIGSVLIVASSIYGFAKLAPDFTHQHINRLSTWVARIDRFATEQSTPNNEKSYKITDENMQIMNSKIAIANGVRPCGSGNSIQRDYLPLAFSDFIYAVLIEEYGILGGLLTMMLYLAILFRAGIIANKSTKAYPALLVIGLALIIVFQAFISMAVTVNLGPVTGQPLPLISRGGTSILFTCIYLGIILSVSQSANEAAEKAKKEEEEESIEGEEADKNLDV